MDANAVILANAESPPSHRLIGCLCKGTPCHTSQAGGARYLGSGLVSFSLIDSWWAATFCLSPALRGGGCFLQSSTVPSRNCARPREECGSFGGVYGFWKGLSSLSDCLDTLAQPVFGRPVCATLCANLGDQSYGSRFGEGGRSGEAISVGFTRFPRFFSLFSPPPQTPALIIRTLASPFFGGKHTVLLGSALLYPALACTTLSRPGESYPAHHDAPPDDLPD